MTAKKKKTPPPPPKVPVIRRAYTGTPIPSDDFINGEIRQCESVIRMCESEFKAVEGRRKEGYTDLQIESYIAGRRKSYSSLIKFLQNHIESLKRAKEYKAKYGNIDGVTNG